MVFSQTSQKTHSILKVVELNRSKPGKSQQIDGLSGVIPKVDTQAGPSHAPLSTSTNISMEEFLKTEPEDFETMYHTDCEFFQDLGLWCSAPAKDELVQTIDSPTNYTDVKTYNINTLNTVSSPLASHGLEVASPAASAATATSLYTVTPSDPLSPTDGLLNYDSKFFYPELDKTNFQEQFLDITSLPVIIEDLESEATPDWANTQHTDYTKTYTDTQYKTPFIDQEDSLDLRLGGAVEPRQVEWTDDMVVSEYVVEPRKDAAGRARRVALPALALPAAPVSALDLPISTPEVLTYVEQLEKETTALHTHHIQWPTEDTRFASVESSTTNSPAAAHVEYEPMTPKTESHLESDEDTKSLASRKRRKNSSDSDETYTPYAERSPVKRTRRGKPNVPIKEMIQALEESQPTSKARRGRPPKRRDSALSSACSVDGSSEYKYREIRDKNNEASKRSRMNRKLKELQMEQLAIDLEERNEKLKVKADILEDMTKRLKDALMTAILRQ